MTMRTTFDTLRVLAVYLLDHLKESNRIVYGIDHRAALIEAMATELGVSFATDEDIRDQAIEEVEEKFGSDNLPEDITETEMYNHARKEIIKSFQGENLAGLYMVESLRSVGIRMTNFILNLDLIEDVFGTDDELIDFFVKKLRKFTLKNYQTEPPVNN